MRKVSHVLVGLMMKAAGVVVHAPDDAADYSCNPAGTQVRSAVVRPIGSGRIRDRPYVCWKIFLP
jgi:hypothetical protein